MTPPSTIHFPLSSVELKASANGRQTFTAIAYSGGSMRVPGYGLCVVDLQGMNLPPSVPLLVEHNANLDSVIGTGKASIQQGRLLVSGELADSDAARKVAEQSKTADLQCSIGADALDFIEGQTAVEANGQRIEAAANRTLTLVKKSNLRELSVVAVGADIGNRLVINASYEGEKDMATIAEADGMIKQMIGNERGRVSQVEAAYKTLSPDVIASGGNLLERVRQRAMRGEMDLPSFQQELLGFIRASRPIVNGVAHSGAGLTGNIVEAALMARMGQSELAAKTYGEHAVEAAERGGRASMIDICRMSLEASGRDAPRNRNEMILAGFSNASIPNVLSNVANKVLLDLYRTASPTWKSFCKVRPVDNFKPQTSIRPSFLGDLQQLGRSGEIMHGSLTDAAVQFTAATFAKMYRLSRQDILNDDLGALDELAPSLANAGMRALADSVYTTLMANAGSFFAGGNNNVQTGGASVLSLTSLGTAISQLRKQQDLEGNTLDIVPTTLVVPPELEQTARQVLHSTLIMRDQTKDEQGMGNPLPPLDLQVEARLSNTSTVRGGAARFANASATAWYLFGRRPPSR